MHARFPISSLVSCRITCTDFVLFLPFRKREVSSAAINWMLERRILIVTMCWITFVYVLLRISKLQQTIMTNFYICYYKLNQLFLWKLEIIRCFFQYGDTITIPFFLSYFWIIYLSLDMYYLLFIFVSISICFSISLNWLGRIRNSFVKFKCQFNYDTRKFISQ